GGHAGVALPSAGAGLLGPSCRTVSKPSLVYRATLWFGRRRVTAILGISAFYHDSAAALVVDGDIVAAAQEERFSREKNDAGFPTRAIHYCLKHGGLKPEQLDYVVFYDKPFTKFERLLETYMAYAPAGWKSFAMAMPRWLKDKLFMRKNIRNGLRGSKA